MIEKGCKIAVKGTFWRVEDIQIRSGKIVIRVSPSWGGEKITANPWGKLRCCSKTRKG